MFRKKEKGEPRAGPMLKNLRWKFIKMAMGSLFIVFLVLILAINLVNFERMDENLNEKLALLEENSGQFPGFSDSGNGGGKSAQNPGPFPTDPGDKKWLTPETRFQIRFFIVADDGIHQTSPDMNLNSIAAVTEAQAQRYFQRAVESGKTFGYCDIYKFYSVTNDAGGHTVVFLDCNQELQSMQSLLKISAAVGALGVVIMFLLVSIFSKIALGPVAESIEKQKQFITDASHEIKTPLGIISANNDVLALQYGGNEWLDSSRRQTQRLKGLVSDMVALTRLDEGSPNLEMEDFLLSDAVLDTAADFTGLAETQGKRLTAVVLPGISYRGNEVSIRQMLGILLDNGVKYSDAGSEIYVHLYRRRKRAVLEVSNPCQELEKDNLGRWFDRFYRADSSRSQKSGYGIGLSLAQAIVQAHGGSISVRSEDGVSVCFTVEL